MMKMPTNPSEKARRLVEELSGCAQVYGYNDGKNLPTANSCAKMDKAESDLLAYVAGYQDAIANLIDLCDRNAREGEAEDAYDDGVDDTCREIRRIISAALEADPCQS